MSAHHQQPPANQPHAYGQQQPYGPQQPYAPAPQQLGQPAAGYAQQPQPAAASRGRGLKIAGGVLLVMACLSFATAKSWWDEGMEMERAHEKSGLGFSGLGGELRAAATNKQGGAKLAGVGGGLLLLVGSTLLLIGVKKGSANA